MIVVQCAAQASTTHDGPTARTLVTRNLNQSVV
ncbi:MAG: hypothetical protein ACI91F_003345 [Candidatus Binatia bacterium]|jgi:hypothetical protein